VSDEEPADETEPAATPVEEPTRPSEPAAPSVDAVAAAPAAPEPASPEPAAGEPAATVATAPPRAERRGGILVPTWVAIVVAALLFGGIGYAIGYVTGDDNGADSANASSSQVTPDGGASDDDDSGFPNGDGQRPAPMAFLGVELESAADNGGARITNVRDDSPAADAGLQSGDVVTKIGDTAVADDDDLIRAVRAREPGDDVTVTYTRDGNTDEAQVTLGDRSEATRSSVSP
jgi:S1-C subfamily serine protease